MSRPLRSPPVLTIAIPAYNDFEMALQTLRSLVDLGCAEKLEIILSDNASSDGLYGHAKNFAWKALPQLKVFRQEINLGFAGNLRFLANQATARWVWFIGVGETVTPGAVSAIVEMLEDYQPSHLLLGAVDKAVLSSGNFEFAGGEAWFHEAISLNVFSRSSVLKADFVSGDSSDDWWPHLKIFLNCFKSNEASGGMVCGSGVVTIAENYSGWWYHKPTVMDLYLEKLELISASLVESIGKKNSAHAFLQSEKNRLTGIQFGLMIAENRKQGLSPFSTRMFAKARLNGVGLIPLLFGILAALTPPIVLKLSSRVRLAVSR